MQYLTCVVACCCLFGAAAEGADVSSTGVPPIGQSSDESPSEQQADFGDRLKALHLPTIVESVASMPYPSVHRDRSALQFQSRQSEMIASICDEVTPQCNELCLIADHQHQELELGRFDRTDRHMFPYATTRVAIRR